MRTLFQGLALSLLNAGVRAEPSRYESWMEVYVSKGNLLLPRTESYRGITTQVPCLLKWYNFEVRPTLYASVDTKQDLEIIHPCLASLISQFCFCILHQLLLGMFHSHLYRDPCSGLLLGSSTPWSPLFPVMDPL